MLPACRTASEGYAIPTFDLAPCDVEGFLENCGSSRRLFTTVLHAVSHVPISSTIWWAN